MEEVAAALVALGAGGAAGCDDGTSSRPSPTEPTAIVPAAPPLPPAPAPTPGARIRVANVGVYDVSALRVAMPDEEVFIGAVPSNALTEYRATKFGAYDGAGYIFADGDLIFGPYPPLTPIPTPVPLAGQAFTYYVAPEVDPLRGSLIRTVRITRDE